MKYKIYYKQDKCNSLFKGDKCLLNMYKAGRHIWPEDNTEITFTLTDNSLIYEITNMSDRTQYLLDNDLLGLGLFVIENRIVYFKNARSTASKERHPKRRWCNHCWLITSASGEIALDYIPISNVLNMLFAASSTWRDPYREDGYDDFYVGIGRYAEDWTCNFRPHKFSQDSVRFWRDNWES